MIGKLPSLDHLKDPHKLHRIDLCGSRRTEYIYFLFFDEEIVYVGVTGNRVDARVRIHWASGKSFTSFAAMNIEHGDMKQVEAFYIQKYNPKYNYMKPECHITENDFSVIDFCVYQNFDHSPAYNPTEEIKDQFFLVKMALGYNCAINEYFSGR